MLAKNKADVLKAFSRAEKLPKPKLSEMFNDVWAVPKGEEIPAAIVSRRSPAISMIHADASQAEQRAELGRLLKKYGDVWAPWRKERKRFVEEGEDVMDCDGRGA